MFAPGLAAHGRLSAWLDELDGDEAVDLLVDLIEHVPGVLERLEAARLEESDDAGEMLDHVNLVMKPTRRFYDYRQANEYADDASDTVTMLRRAAGDRATPGLVPVIERAITLATRAIVKSDDSSGLQGDLIRDLLDAHATATRASDPPLTQAEQTRLVKWLINYRYDGTQDFFDPDIVAYAPGLNAKSVEQYRRAIHGIDLGTYGTYPLRRLAVLDKDLDAIVAAHGGAPKNAMTAASLVESLEEAGLHAAAVEYARLGLSQVVDGFGRNDQLLDFLIADARDNGDRDAAVELAGAWFQRFTNLLSFSKYRELAIEAGTWEGLAADAERLFAVNSPDGYTRYLLEEQQADAAWQFAITNGTGELGRRLLEDLCDERAKSYPAETLPHYKTLVLGLLSVTDVRNYRAAAHLLKKARAVAARAGVDDAREFAGFILDVAEQNRRRPRCIEEFRKAGLLAR